MSYVWQGGPNQGQVLRNTFGGGYLGTPHNMPGTMLPSHNGSHQSIGRADTPNKFIPRTGFSSQNARVPGFPNFSSARGSSLKYLPPP